MLNMIGGGGAGPIAAGLLPQAPETWNPALYQLAVSVHDFGPKVYLLAPMFPRDSPENRR